MRRATFLVLFIAIAVALTSCERRANLTIVNACDSSMMVSLWERPSPREAQRRGAKGKRVKVPALTIVTISSALDDVDGNGSSALIVSGPGAGTVLRIRHGTRNVIVPARVCEGDD